MDIKTAIKVLEDGNWWDFARDMPGKLFDELHEAVLTAIAVLKEAQAAKNEPLTADEVREMKGKLVYCPNGNVWIQADHVVELAVANGAKIYRRPPQKEE